MDQIIQERYQDQIAIALSYFPELKKANIRFYIKISRLAFASRPNWKTLWGNKSQREYLIILSAQSDIVPEKLLFHNLPFNAQIGILGHELSHTVFYLKRNTAEIMLTGLKYLNSKYRIKFERETDEATIRRGLGRQLYEYALYSQNPLNASPEYIGWLNKYYLRPEEILDRIKK
jgi:hypothetical protein